MLKRWIVLGLFSLMLLGVANAFAIIVPCPNNRDVDSSAAIFNALFEAKNGGTVQLEEGKYYLHNPVVVNFPFKGKLIGVGKGKTILTTDATDPADPIGHPGHKIPLLEATTLTWPAQIPVLFWFNIPGEEASDIWVSDLSVVITDPMPVVSADWESGQIFATFLVDGAEVNTRFERIGFQGIHGGYFDAGWDMYLPNIFIGIQVFGNQKTETYMHGNHIISDCSFDHIVQSYAVFGVENGTLQAVNNSLSNGVWGFWYDGISNSQVEISRNVMTAVWEPILILAQADFSTPPPESSKFVIQQNNIVNGGAGNDGMWLEDLQGSDKKLDLFVSQNSIAGEGMWTPITAAFTNGTIITNNRIDANAAWAIQIFGCSNGLLKGNNVQNFESWQDLPAILLGGGWGYPNTTNYTVVGGSNKTNVVEWGDPGADYGNVVVGVNNMRRESPGPAIRDAMKRKMEMIKSLRQR
jgi:hypothetical protein